MEHVNILAHELPWDILYVIFSQLPTAADVGRCALVCTAWYGASKEDTLWQLLARAHFRTEAEKTRTGTWLGDYKAMIVASHGWKDFVAQFFVIGQHDKRAMYADRFENTIVSSGEEGAVKMWNIEQAVPASLKNIDQQPIRVLQGHTDWVRMCRTDGVCIYTASDDSTVRVWNFETGECIEVLKHLKDVHDVRLFPQRGQFLSVGERGFAYLWDMTTLKLVQQIPTTVDVWSMDIFGQDLLVGGDFEKKVTVWDLQSNKVVRRLEGHNDHVRCVKTYGNDVITSGLDGLAFIWDVVAGKMQSQIDLQCKKTYDIQIDDWKIVIACTSPHVVRVVDRHTHEFIRDVEPHENEINSVRFDGLDMLTTADDCKVVLTRFAPAPSPA